MKIRLGFVSNSSSSSYTCDVCKEDASGWDIGLDEAEMKRCVNGHTFCDSHQTKANLKVSLKEMKRYLIEDYDLDKDEVNEMSAEDIEEEYNVAKEGNEDERYDCSFEICPCCLFEYIADEDLIAYALKELNLTRESVTKLFKNKFKNYDNFKKQYVKES